MSLAEALTARLGGRWHGGYGITRRPAEPLKRKPKRSAEGTRRYLLEIWRSSRPAPGTRVEGYLQARGITMEIPPSIRFHPALKHSETGLLLPCMIAGVQSLDRQIIALHRTFLCADGEGKAQVSNPRKFLGSVRGGAVRFAAAGPELAVGEGVETSLTYLQLTGRPTWAALSSAGLTTIELPPLPLAATVFILVDRDPAGEQAAQVAAARFGRKGRVVKLVRPAAGNDINDLVMATAPW
jgi:putative DNA primase/helicase